MTDPILYLSMILGLGGVYVLIASPRVIGTSLKTFFVLSSTASAQDFARSLERKVLDLGPT